MVWIIKKGVFTLLSSEYRHWARTVNSLKAWFTRATQMQMQEPTTFIRQNQTQGRQNTQEQSRTVKLFPRWRSRVKLILRVLKGRKKYLFNATENIRLYGIQFIWLYLLFIFFIVIHTVFLSLGSFAKSFQARIYLHNVYHKAPYISLYYLLISRLNRGGMEPMEPVFFLLSLRLHLRLRFLGSHVWNANASANESKRKWNFFHFLLWRLRLRWCSSHVYFLAFAFAFASHVWTRLKT